MVANKYLSRECNSLYKYILDTRPSFFSSLHEAHCRLCRQNSILWGRHGPYRMVVKFTTTYVMCAYHH